MNRIENQVLATLGAHVGKQNAIGRYDLLQQVNRYLRDKISERELRAVIQELCIKGEPICSAGGTGYWIPASLNEVMETAAELESKSKSMLLRANRLKRAGIARLGRQAEMF